MNWWHYLLLSNLYLALFYGFYLLFLRKETYFMLNRVYLVSAAILSFFIPMMQAEWVKNLFITQKVQQTIYYVSPGFTYQIVPQESGFTVEQFFTTLYWTVAMLLLARLFYRFFRLKQYIQTEETGSAFSFFGKIKVDKNLPQKDVIYQHEMVHAQHLHSADVLLFEALTILNWFNPVIYFYRKAIKHNHEFIADRNAVSFGIDKADYAMLLLSESIGVQPNMLVNSFFNQSLLKQRIMMLHKNPSKRSALLKYGLSAPLFVAMLVLTSATINRNKTIKKISATINSDTPIKEVVEKAKEPLSAYSKPPKELKLLITIVQKLKGKVVDINGQPLAGVKISYDKNSMDFTTDNDGNFSVPNYMEGDLLTFKSEGRNTIAKRFNDLKSKLAIVVLQPIGLLGTVTNLRLTSDQDSSKVTSFAAVEKLPSFPGGEEGFGTFLATHIRYPKDAKAQKITGRVIVSFIVEKNGKLTNIEVLRDIGGGAGAEAIRVLEESPAWNPGIQNGKVVRVAYTMPINFTLDDGTKTITGNTENMPKPAATVTGYINMDTVKAGTSINLRGLNNINKALVIVDGVEAKGVNPLGDINPNDIESITVLKDASATTKYGDKGKNGVIEITTKKDKKAIETKKP